MWKSLNQTNLTMMVLVNIGFNHLDVKVEIPLLLDRVGLVQFINLKPAFQTGEVVGEIKDR